MKVAQRLWTIEKLIGLKDNINLNPIWQRGPAWKASRRVLLMDSILREMDVPKIYLRKLPAGSLYSYEAVDGQQRLRAIWDFVGPADGAAGFALSGAGALEPINGHVINGKTFAELDASLKQQLRGFKIGVGEIVSATNDEITTLFARLQMGMPLNPAELRNAALGPMRNIIQLTATSHEFFASAKINNDRSKYFDYASHAFAIAAWNGTRDIKSTDLRALQTEYAVADMEDILGLSSKVGDALNVLAEIDQHTRFRITRKWIYVDLLWVIMQLHEQGKSIDVQKITAKYNYFEERRRKYTSEPDLLLNSRRRDAAPNDRALYEYIYAFRADGASKTNLQKRNKALRKFLRDVEVD